MPPQAGLLSGTAPFLKARLLSSTAPFLLPGTAPLPSISFPFPSTLPPLHGIGSLPASPSSPAPTLFGPRRLPSSSAPTLSAPSAPSLPALFDQTGSNEGPLFSHIWSNGGPWLNKDPPFGHVSPFGQIWPNKGPLFGQTEPNIGPFVRSCLTERCQKRGGVGPERADSGKPGRGAGRKQVLGSEGRVLAF